MIKWQNKALGTCQSSLWPDDAIWINRSVSTLSQIMGGCLAAPSHYLNQCSLIINGALWYSNIKWNVRSTYLSNDINKTGITIHMIQFWVNEPQEYYNKNTVNIPKRQNKTIRTSNIIWKNRFSQCYNPCEPCCCKHVHRNHGFLCSRVTIECHFILWTMLFKLSRRIYIHIYIYILR